MNTETILGGGSSLGTVQSVCRPLGAIDREESEREESAVPSLELSSEERMELAACMGVIEKGMETFLQVGQALMSIRDKRLYRETHNSFEDWCQESYGWTSRRAWQYISAAQTMKNLERPAPDGNLSTTFMLPASEAQVRPLVALPPEEQRAAWAEAVATSPGRLTKRHVEAVVRARRGVSAAAPPEHPAEKSAGAEPDVNGKHVALPGGNGDALRLGPSTLHSRGPGERETRVSEAADRAIAQVRELQDLMGTPDSAIAADVIRALESLQNLKDHLRAVERMQAG